LLLANDGGRWALDAVRAKVAGKAPTLTLVKSKLGLCGGYAAVPRTTSGYDFVGDPTGASFVFSIEPKVERFALVDKRQAVRSGCVFGDGCIWISARGKFERNENTYAVPSGWASEWRKFARFEIWHLAQ
jgi:hypothetical protein